jgi:hypothetical protein
MGKDSRICIYNKFLDDSGTKPHFENHWYEKSNSSQERMVISDGKKGCYLEAILKHFLECWYFSFNLDDNHTSVIRKLYIYILTYNE